MKPGKVSQAVYQKAIQKKLNDDKTAYFHPDRIESCYAARHEDGEEVIACDVSLYGDERDLCVFALAQAMNHLAAKEAKILGVDLQIMLPQFAYESRLKAMMNEAERASKEWGIPILSADARVVPHIETTIVHVGALGSVPKDKLTKNCKPLAGQDIVQINHIGSEGALRILRARRQELEKRFSRTFLDQIESMDQELSAGSELKIAAAIGVSAMHQVVDGGILAALWDLAETAKLGLSVDMKKIAIRQEAIEVCECFHLNPYMLTSAGCMLVVTDKGEELADALIQQGMSAVVIGHTLKGNEKILMNGEETRYLERPAPDELNKILELPRPTEE